MPPSMFWSMILPNLVEEFSVSSATAQLGSSLLMAGYAASSVVLAKLSAKIGRKWAASFDLILFLIATFIIPYCNSFTMILVLRFVQGWGIVWGMNIGLASAWSPENRRGFASGLVSGGLCAGLAFGGWFAAKMLETFGNWRSAFSYGAYIMLVFIALFIIFAQDPPKGLYADSAKTEMEVPASASKRNIWKHPGLWLCVIALFMTSWSSIAYQTVLPDYCYSLGYSTAQAGNILVVIGVLASLKHLSEEFFRIYLCAAAASR